MRTMPKVGPSLWLARHAMLYLIVSVTLFIAIWDSPQLFALLASVLLLCVLFFAGRAADKPVGKAWWAGLGLVLGLFFAMCNAIAFTSGDEERQCLSRYRQPALWTRPVNIGPDPNCQIRGPSVQSGDLQR